MSEERNNEGWRNWGDHPLFVLLSAIGVILGIIGTIYTVIGFYKSNKTSSEEDSSVIVNLESNSAGKNISKGFTFGVYVAGKIDRYGEFSEKFESAVIEVKPSKVSVINLQQNNQSIWAAPSKDFNFDWEGRYIFSLENSPKLIFRKMFGYISSESDSSKCINIYDLKRRLAKDNYQKNIFITSSTSSCGNNEPDNLELPSNKKVLVLLLADSSDNSQWFYQAEETLKKVFPTSEISPFVSITDSQIVDFLQNQ